MRAICPFANVCIRLGIAKLRPFKTYNTYPRHTTPEHNSFFFQTWSQWLAVLLKMPALDSKTPEAKTLIYEEANYVGWSRSGEKITEVRGTIRQQCAKSDSRAMRQGVSVACHPACGMNVTRSGSIEPIWPLDVVIRQHIAFSTNRTVNICFVVAVESAELPILIIAQPQYIPHHVSSHM